MTESNKKKKSYIFIISVHCPTRRQVPPVLKSIFKIRTLTPKLYIVLTNMISCTSFVNIGDMFLQTIRVNKRFVAPITLMQFKVLVNPFDMIFYFCFGTKSSATQMALVIFSSFMNIGYMFL